MKSLSSLSLVLVLAAAGCKTTGPRFDPRSSTAALPPGFVSAGQTNRIHPEWLQPSPAPFRLGPGDKLDIELLEGTDSRVATFVCPDGKIYYDLLPGLNVAGLSLAEAKALLEHELAAFYKRPTVAISLVEVQSQRIWVLGRLNKCGIFPLTGPTRLIEAISQAGGLMTSRQGGTTEELADLNHSFLIRKGEMLPVDFQRLLRDGDTSQNIFLEPDDFIYLPSSLSQEIFVLGAVNRPSPLGFSGDLTLVSALAKSMGPQPGAQLSHIAIVRGSLADPKIAIVDFKAIMTGKQPDVRLEPRDIVFVPDSPYRTLERYAKLVTDTFVRTVAANEGGHAGSRSFTGVGVSSSLK